MDSLNISVYDYASALAVAQSHPQISGIILRYSLLADEIQTKQITDELVRITRQNDIKLYLKDNRLLHNMHIQKVKENMLLLSKYNIGIFAGDPAIIAIAQEINYDGEIIFAPEMVMTSHRNGQFWIDQGAAGIEISHELTFKEINAMMELLTVKPFVQIHGQLSMFQSRRLLIDNYFNHLQKDDVIDENSQLSLYDKERDLHYTITQDTRGTEIYNGQTISIIDLLDRFVEKPHYIVDTYFLTAEKRNRVIELYVQALMDSAYLENKKQYAIEMQHIYQTEQLSRGFFLKPTIF